jgi:hypothetical protein
MANVLPRGKQVAVISALAEGSGIREIERMTGINRNTTMNLGVRVGKAPIAYAWVHDTDNPAKPKRHVTVFRIHPITSPLLAVRAAIVQEFRNAETVEG